MFKDDIQRTIYNIGILPLLKIAPRYRRRRSVGCTRNYTQYTKLGYPTSQDSSKIKKEEEGGMFKDDIQRTIYKLGYFHFTR